MRIREVLEKEGMAEASKHVSDEMIDPLGAFTTPDKIIERIEEYVYLRLCLRTIVSR
jgi:hypothetical protein